MKHKGSSRNDLTASLYQPALNAEQKSDVLKRLKSALTEMRRMCRAEGDPLARGETRWPSNEFLNQLSSDIRSLASLYHRGKESTWSCILGIDNRLPSLNLKERIEDLVDRASKLYQPTPRALQIKRQAKEGNLRAQSCFQDLQKCFNRQLELTSIEWEKHHSILAPKPAKGESCRDRAAQICIDWLRWENDVHTPAAPLTFWLLLIANPNLAKKLGYLGSENPFDQTRLERAQNERRKHNKLRQRKHRLQGKEHKLAKKERELAKVEIEIIDSPTASKAEREAAADRLIRYTDRAPDEWRRLLAKKA